MPTVLRGLINWVYGIVMLRYGYSVYHAFISLVKCNAHVNIFSRNIKIYHVSV